MCSRMIPNTSFVDRQDGHSHPIGAALTFIVILLGLGVPVWWNTTTVQRASLPLEELSNMAKVSGSEQSFPILLKGISDAEIMAKKLQNVIVQSKDSLNYNFTIVPYKFSPEEVKIMLSKNSVDAIDKYFEELSESKEFIDMLSIVQVPSNYLPSGKVCVGRHNFLYFSEETDFNSLGHVLRSILALHDSDRNSIIAHLPISNHYNVLLTLATTNATQIYSTLVSSFDENFVAFSKKFRHVADLSISSQMIYLGNGHIDANYNAENKMFSLNEEKVVSLINILEPRLGSQLSSDPTFHWVLYVPHVNQSPMYILKGSLPIVTNAVLSPRWNGGGLQIVNELDHSFAGLALCQLRNALGIFSPQFVYNGYCITKNTDTSYISLNYDKSGVHAWELYWLTRRRTVQFLNQATITLKSLSQLLKQIGNIVVSEEIRDLIVASIKMGDNSRTALKNGNLQQAYQDAQVSNTCAEKAFFDPSLLALLYFPEDQKYAIYIPLFLPIGIPVLLSLRSVYKHFLKR